MGKGYSENFVKNMTEIVAGIENNALIHLQTQPDVICAECPNLESGRCKLDGNNVVSKDEDLVNKLSLDTTVSRPAKELFAELNEKVTEEIFEESCHNCSWYQMGLCNYQLYKKNLARFL